MQSFVAGQSNEITYDILNRISGDPLVAGVVNCYLRAKNGAHSGKYFQASDSTWQNDPAVAGAAVHNDDGHWSCTIPAAAWIAGVTYATWAKEGGALHVSVSEEVSEKALVIEPSFEATIES